jgi:hypothetical protein
MMYDEMLERSYLRIRCLLGLGLGGFKDDPSPEKIYEYTEYKLAHLIEEHEKAMIALAQYDERRPPTHYNFQLFFLTLDLRASPSTPQAPLRYPSSTLHPPLNPLDWPTPTPVCPLAL